MTILGTFRVQTVIMAATLCVAALAAGAGLSGLFAVRQLGESIAYSAQNTAPSLGQLANIAVSIGATRVKLAQHILASDPSEQKRVDSELLDSLEHTDALLGKYDALVSDEVEQVKFDKLKKDWTAWKGVAALIRDLSLQQRTAEAMALYNEKSKPAGKELDAALNDELNFNVAMGETAGKTGEQRVARSSTLITVLLGIIAAVSAVALLAVRNRLAVPLSRLTAAMREMAQGDFDRTVPGLELRDEIGAIGKALDAIRTGVASRAREQAEAQAQAQRIIVDSLAQSLGKLKNGQLDCSISKPFPESYERLRIDFNDTVDTLSVLMRDVSSSAENVGTGSAEIASAANDLANRTTSQAGALEESAAAVRDLREAVTETARIAADARQNAQQAESEAVNGGEVMLHAAEAMEKIAQSSHRMGEIVSLIDGIAFQTNLLALNAGVEAARAGDAGKGFAVVATEVRSLAERSAEAAREISGIIKISGAEVSNGVDMMNRTKAALEQIVQRTGSLASMIGDIAQSASDQSSAIAQVNEVMGQLDTATQQNAALVEESTAASSSLASEAGRLSGLVSRFVGGASATRVAPSPVARPKAAAYRAPMRMAVGSNIAPQDNQGWDEF